MDDYYSDDEKYFVRSAVQPQKYNIVLTRDGESIDFDFSPATGDLLTRYGYVQPLDTRCAANLVDDEDALYTTLAPILGKAYRGQLAYHTNKQVIISLHDTAILGYQRQMIIDPRISNEIATFWEIYLDQRVFPESLDRAWRENMAQNIVTEKESKEADRILSEKIKVSLLNGESF